VIPVGGRRAPIPYSRSRILPDVTFLAVACPHVVFMNSPHCSFPWYAIQVRPKYEKQVVQSIGCKEINTFLPLYAEKRKWSDRVKELEVPLFDGYVFCQLDITKRLPILQTPGVIRFVGLGKTPIPVDGREMEAVRTVVDSGSVFRPWKYLREGDEVRIDEGPLRNVEGILVSDKEQSHVVVSINLLQRAMAVQVEKSWLSPVRPWARAARVNAA